MAEAQNLEAVNYVDEQDNFREWNIPTVGWIRTSIPASAGVKTVQALKRGTCCRSYSIYQHEQSRW